MVERLKSAIDKARAQRTGLGAAPAPAVAARAAHGAAPAAAMAGAAAAAVATPETDLSDWSVFAGIDVDERRLERERIVTRNKRDDAYRAIDMLRTRAMRAMQEKNWRRLAITSPTKGAGKTMIAANLAFSLARQKATRTLLIDLDLAAPRLGAILDPNASLDIRNFLLGDQPAEEYFVRVGQNLLVGLNMNPVPDSAEVLQSEQAKHVLDQCIAQLKPDVVIFDLAPVMVSDDALNVLTEADCALMVIAAGDNTADEIRKSETLIQEWTPLLGVVLNKSEERAREGYGY